MPPSLSFALLLAAGLTLGVHLGTALGPLAAYLTAASLTGASLAYRRGLRGLPEALIACTVVSGATLHGMYASERAERPPLRRWFDLRGDRPQRAAQDDGPVLVRGRLTRDASLTEAGASLQVAVSQIAADGQWQRAPGGVWANVAGGLASGAVGEWRAGREVEFPAVLRRPARYLNWGVPDAERSMALRGTALVASVKSAALVDVRAHGRWWDEQAATLRAFVRAAMTRHVGVYDPVSAAIGTAILIGDRAQMGRDLQQRLQEAGTYHVVAISGGNIALLAVAVLGVLWAVHVRFAGAALVALVLLAAHGWVIGGEPSVVRATVMAVVYLGLRAFDLRTAPVNALGIGASLMLLANPLDVVNAGFWLTFGATGALLAAGARWQLKRPTRRWHAAAAICMASLAVEVVLTPVSAFVFQRVTVAGLILNLAAVPAMGVVQGAASACVLFDASGLAAAADAAGRVTHWGARVLVDSSRLVDLAPWATWRVPAPASWAMATYYVSLLGWWLALRNTSRHRRVLIRACGTTAAALWLLIATAPQTYVRAALDTQLRLTAFDVGQGDAFLVTFPDGHTLLVDAGGTSASGAFDIGDRVLGPALRARGLGQVDYLAVTHGDLDHIGGAVSLIRDFRVTEVWAGVPVAGHSPERLLRVAADARRTVWRWMQRGDRLHVGAVELRVHHPPVPEWERQRVRNDDSLVLEIRYGDISLLLTGDISRTVESDLLGLVDLRPTVVLKAPHHGSGTSSSMPFLLRLQPRALLVSAGRGNPYGHPTPEVLQRYHAIDASVFRTDHDGQIELATDGYSIEVTTFSGRKWRMR